VSLINLSASACLAPSSAVTTVRPLEDDIGKTAQESQIRGCFETLVFKLFGNRSRSHFRRGRRSRPVQRGATQRYSSNQRSCCASRISLRLRRAELVSAIGTFQKARFHRIVTTDIKPKDELIEVDGPMELAAVDGVVADGEPHFHMVFQDMNRAYAAHLEEGSVVCHLAEIVLAEIKGVELARIRNEHGIALLQEKK
jgi:predicted DNA-binding protein with PD1-like motif